MTSLAAAMRLFAPAVPVVERTAWSLIKETAASPQVQAVTLWISGLAGVSQIGRLVPQAPPPALIESLPMVGRRAVIAGGVITAVGALGALVARCMRKKPLITVKPYAFESQVDGSSEINMQMAASQVAFALGSDGTIEQVGSGVRIDASNKSFLITAGHNVNRSAKTYYIVKNGDFYEIPKANVEGCVHLAADAIAIEIPASAFARLGVARAQLAFQPNGAFASITGLSGLGVNGKLVLGQFGRLQFLGTTRAGYSGAPYWSGKGVFGIHTNGGVANEGYSLAFLYQLLKLELGIEDEGIYDFTWFKRFVQKNRDKQILDRGSHVVMIDEDGHVYNLPSSQHAAFEAAMVKYNEEQDFADSYVPESLNYQRPGFSRAGQRSASAPPSGEEALNPARVLESMQRYNELWKDLPQSSKNAARKVLATKLPSPAVRQS